MTTKNAQPKPNVRYTNALLKGDAAAALQAMGVKNRDHLASACVVQFEYETSIDECTFTTHTRFAAYLDYDEDDYHTGDYWVMHPTSKKPIFVTGSHILELNEDDMRREETPQIYFAIRFVNDKTYVSSVTSDGVRVVKNARDAKAYKTVLGANKAAHKLSVMFGEPIKIMHVTSETLSSNMRVRTFATL